MKVTERWEPGDIVLDSNGSIYCRSNDTSEQERQWPWHVGCQYAPVRGETPLPEGSVDEDHPVRPITLLVRNGHRVPNDTIPEEHGIRHTAELVIKHMDDQWTNVELGVPGAVTWLPTSTGLMVKRDWTGHRTVYPWATIRSYTVIPRDKPTSTESLRDQIRSIPDPAAFQPSRSPGCDRG